MLRINLFWSPLLATVLLAGCGQGSAEPTVDPAVLTVQAFDANTALDQLPTFDVSTLPTATLALPEPDILTTQQLNNRLNPFGDEAVCELPCYLGLTPGLSDIQDTLFFYRRLGIASGDLLPGDLANAADGEGALAAALTKTTDVDQAADLGLPPPNVEVFVQDEIVQYIYVAWRDYPDYLPYADFVAAAGEPDRVELAINSETNRFLLQAAYDERMFGYAVQGTATDTAEGKALCLNDQGVDVTYLGMFAPNVTPLEGLPNSQLLLPVEEALGELDTSSDCLVVTVSQLTAWERDTP